MVLSVPPSTVRANGVTAPMISPWLSGHMPDLEASGQAASDAVARAAAVLVSPAGYACEAPAISSALITEGYYLMSKRAATSEAARAARYAARGEAEHRTLSMKYAEQAMDMIRLTLENKTLRAEIAALRAPAAVAPSFPARALRHGLKVGG